MPHFPASQPAKKVHENPFVNAEGLEIVKKIFNKISRVTLSDNCFDIKTTNVRKIRIVRLDFAA